MRVWLGVCQGHSKAYQKSPKDIRDPPAPSVKFSVESVPAPFSSGNHPMGARHLPLPSLSASDNCLLLIALGECGMVHFVHALVYALCHTIYTIYYYLKICLNTISHASWATSDVLPSYIDQLRAPPHLAVIFAWTSFKPNKVYNALQDVRRLAAWCAAVGTRELTVYDEDGYLAQAISQTSDPKAGAQAPNLLVDAHFGAETAKDFHQKNPIAIRYPLSPTFHGPRLKMHVNVLTKKDDKLVLSRALESTRESGFTSSEVSRQLLSIGPMQSMPDMLVVCDERAGPPCLHGFPCWMVRITTIRSLPTWSLLGRWTPKHFVDTLNTYTSAEQRYGA